MLLNYVLFGVLLTVGAGIATAYQNVSYNSNTNLRIKTPFDLVRDSAYNQVSEDLEEIMATLNQRRAAGTAVKIILKIGTAFVNKYKANKEEQGLINMIEQQTKMVMDTLNVIKKMLEEIRDQLTIEFNEIKFNQKYAAMQELIVGINVYFDDFVLHLTKYTEAEELGPRLRTLTENFRASQLDMKLVRMAIEEEAGGTDSLVFAYAKFLEVNNAGINTSPNQQIMFFYQNILMHAHRANVLLEICYELLGELENVNVSGDLNYVRGRLTLNHNNLSNGAKKAFKEFDQPRYQMTYTDKLKDNTGIEDTNFFQMNRVGYTFFARNREISQNSGQDNCRTNCFDFKFQKFKNDYCNGEVYNCKYTDASFSAGVQLKVINNDNRLYSGYWLGKNKYGDFDGPGQIVNILPSTQSGYQCMVCMCTCNNIDGANSNRYFYNQDMSAPNGYVVTGIRFVKKYFNDIKKYVIFIQPEVSELIDLARVNTTTTRWLDIPSSVPESHLHKLQRINSLTVQLGNIEFTKKAYMTGVRFVLTEWIPAMWRIQVQVLGKEIVINNGIVSLGNHVEGQLTSDRSVSIFTTDENADAGQHISPTFEIRNNNLTEPMPLIGIRTDFYEIKYQQRNLRVITSQLRTDNFGDVFQ